MYSYTSFSQPSGAREALWGAAVRDGSSVLSNGHEKARYAVNCAIELMIIMALILPALTALYSCYSC